MRSIYRWFVRAKSHEVFLLLFVPSTVAGLVGGNLESKNGHPQFDSRPILTGLLAIAIVYSLLLWFWSIGKLTNSAVKPELRMNFAAFRFGIGSPAIYTLFAIPAFTAFSDSNLFIILPFHLVAVGCVIYDMNFISKSMLLCDRKKPVSFFDYAGPFFLLWFWPIGIWSIQPRINRIYAKTARDYA